MDKYETKKIEWRKQADLPGTGNHNGLKGRVHCQCLHQQAEMPTFVGKQFMWMIGTHIANVKSKIEKSKCKMSTKPTQAQPLTSLIF